MYVVLCYDVVENRRRSRLFRQLKGFLVPVQRSVFEGELPVRRWEELLRVVRRWEELLRVVRRCVDPLTDSVRIYTLCGGCSATIFHFGTAIVVADGEEPVVI